MKKVLAVLMATLAVATVLVGVETTQTVGPRDPASALTGSQFDPGDIISDQNFFDGASMTTASIQSFLSTEIGTCKSSQCLSNGSFSLDAHVTDAMCTAIAGGTALSTAQIITQVSSACGISPKVILVTLQKEQNLVSGTVAQNPSTAVLARAMGYACPDTANGACDPAYSGVGNQIYRAAWQWKRYANPAGTSVYFTWFAPGGTRSIQYSPTVSCGTRAVTVENQATADLYYYTPYTPDQAALANLYGTGDACSAYGNRNFWRIYSDWFGDPTGAGDPIGTLDSLSAGVESVTVSGWAMDVSLATSTSVDVYVDGKGTRISADRSRPDVAAAYPGRGAAHGFSATLPASVGTQDVCVYAIGVDTTKNTDLGCRTVTVQSGSPYGSVDSVEAAPGGIETSGWALDPESSSSIKVATYIDSRGVQYTANGSRPDVLRVAPTTGSLHGFSTTLAATPGSHTVCTYGINVGTKGVNTLLAPCATVTVPVSGGSGSLDSVTTSGPSLSVAGWALDGGSTGSTHADVYIDGKGHRLTANGARTDVARVYPGYGSAHGFSGTFTVGYGTHQVCAYAISATGSNNLLRCTTVTMTNAAPVGSLDAATGVQGGIAVRGWAIDPDTRAPIDVDVYVDGRGRRLLADAARTDVARAYPASGADHGFASTISASAGQHTVCAYAIDSTGGDNPTLACTAVTVP